MREVAVKGMLFFTLGLSSGLSFTLDKVLTLQLLGPETSKRMTIAMRIFIAAVGILIALSQPVWPASSERITATANGFAAILLRGISISTCRIAHSRALGLIPVAVMVAY